MTKTLSASATAAAGTLDYRPDIDGLRAAAVLAVVLFHAFPSALPGGFVGVDVFFVISGYLITGILIADLGTDQFSLRRFYARRIRRLFPALVIVLLTTYAMGWFSLYGDEYRELGKHIVASAGFVSNWVSWTEAGYFDQAAQAKPLLHLWSLGVEEQFYIVWPLVLWAAHKARRVGWVCGVFGL
ncbi:acyltransferase, partial [Ralstonia pickettii]|nr:acyltransferase [Ralstonia pickettii]